MSRLLGTVLAFVASAAIVAGVQPPDGGRKGGPDKGDKKAGKGQKGKRGFQLGTVLPPFVVEELDLTADQEKKLAALEKEVKAKLEKILTPDQIKRLEEMGPPMGKGGPPGGGGPEGGPMPREKKGDRPE